MMRNMAIKVYESRIMAFNVSPKYLPIFCIFHNSIRKSLGMSYRVGTYAFIGRKRIWTNI